jgi:AcrR family transcriptional regulator
LDKRNDRGQATRDHIITAATKLFAERGYPDTSIELVLKQCDISRGALYHHFASKEALFTAVLEAVETNVTSKVIAVAQKAANPLDALRQGCFAWLALARDPTVRQIALIDAPSVIGWQKWRQIDNKHALGLLRNALGMIAAAGRIPPHMVDMYAHMLIAVMAEVSLVIARSSNAASSMKAGKEAVEMLLSRLASVEPHGSW